MLRRLLDALYWAGAAVAALALLGIFLMMMAQVILREMGFQLPGADDLVAYLCVASAFFALAFTFRRGELIRVGLGIERIPQGTVPFPIWIPKLSMPLGAGLLLLAVLDELARVALAGRKPSYVAAAEDRAARGDFSAEV